MRASGSLGRGDQGILRPGRPKIASETRELDPSNEHGKSALGSASDKLGIEVSQATVGRYMPWRPKRALPYLAQLPAKSHDGHRRGGLFVVATATFG